MMEFAASRIMVFAKAPQPGRTKTRLIPALGAAGAAALHERLIHHTLNTATEARLCPVELWCGDQPSHPFFQSCLPHYDITLRVQHGADLGERMGNAFIAALAAAPSALLIGTDTPSLNSGDLRAALAALDGGNDCVLCPAADGGYVLIGLRRYDARLFNNIEWGSDTVLEMTRARLRQLEWRWRELDTHHDIDRPEDLVLIRDIFNV